MPLKKYHKKRDFKKTPEPKGKKRASKTKNLYLIQKHAASHLHYDFRIELDGVLKSWAVPKGPSLDPSVKRLAVHVEDHPIEYGSFEGTIPEGEYGGGTVMLWDTGTWESEDSDPEQTYKKGSLKFILKGKKLKGGWKLIQIKKDPKNWLLIKAKDKYAKPEGEYNITKEKPLSAVSRKTMEKIAGKKKQLNEDAPSKKTFRYAELSGSKKSPMPKVIFPELAFLTDSAPKGKNWIHEIKFDGYRLLCFIKDNKVRFVTRGKKDWTNKFSSVVAALNKMKLPDCILDGEMVVLDKNQRSDFQLLQNALSEKETSDMIYYVFDLIYSDGYSLLNTPLIDRKKSLRQLIPSVKHPKVRYSDYVTGNGPDVFKKACKLHLEGIISKEIDSLYTQKRTRDWLKIKCILRQEFVVGGFTKPKGSRKYFGSLLLGYYDKDKKLRYCGHVGTGFDEKSLGNMAKKLEKVKTIKKPFLSVPSSEKNVTWIKPTIVIEVEFREWTHDGILRQASFKGLREDKSPKQVIREEPK